MCCGESAVKGGKCNGAVVRNGYRSCKCEERVQRCVRAILCARVRMCGDV